MKREGLGETGAPETPDGYRWRAELLDQLSAALFNSGVTNELLAREPARLRTTAQFCRHAAASLEAECAFNLLEVATSLEKEAVSKEISPSARPSGTHGGPCNPAR